MPRPAVVGEIRTEFVAPPRRAGTLQVRPATIAWLFALVLLPTLVVAAYSHFIAADVFETEAKFWIRGQESGTAPAAGGGGLRALLGRSSPAASFDEALSIANYVRSRDALTDLDERIDLRALYRRPEADFHARLPDDATQEDLFEYYVEMIDVEFEPMSGIVTLKVRAFRPDDAVLIADTLLTLSEQMVNHLNTRAQEDVLAFAREELARAEARMAKNRADLTRFRQEHNNLDPNQTSGAILGLVANLEADIAKTEADLSERRSYMRPDSMEIAGLEAKLKALRQQAAKENARLTGTQSTFAEVVSQYEVLLLERELANRNYESALSSLESARADANRQHHYLVRVVSPNLPDEAAYPLRWQNVATVFFGTLLMFAFGRLILAGVRDHIIR